MLVRRYYLMSDFSFYIWTSDVKFFLYFWGIFWCLVSICVHDLMSDFVFWCLISRACFDVWFYFSSSAFFLSAWILREPQIKLVRRYILMSEFGFWFFATGISGGVVLCLYTYICVYTYVCTYVYVYTNIDILESKMCYRVVSCICSMPYNMYAVTHCASAVHPKSIKGLINRN